MSNDEKMKQKVQESLLHLNLVASGFAVAIGALAENSLDKHLFVSLLGPALTLALLWYRKVHEEAPKENSFFCMTKEAEEKEEKNQHILVEHRAFQANEKSKKSRRQKISDFILRKGAMIVKRRKST